MTTEITTGLPGLVVATHVQPGESVAIGDRLLTVETMKCESPVRATAPGRVRGLLSVGDLVKAGATVARIEPEARRARPPRPADALAVALAGWGKDAWFTELDLDPLDAGNGEHLDTLSPVDRTLGEQDSGVVVGVLTHRFPGHSQPTSRVWIAGDPARMMGAVAEDECRRIIAAFDLAAANGIPVEWVAVSAGAQISMDSGTENMDWCASVVRRILQFTQAGGEVDVIVAGINVGAQSYWNSVATMLGHCAGLLVMVDGTAMVLTGRRALATSGGVSAASDLALGGYADVMGPNGQAHHRAADLAEAYRIVLDHHRLVARTARPVPTSDPIDRDVCTAPYDGALGHATVGDILDAAANPGRKVPFEIRPVMAAVADADAPRLERWTDMAGGDAAVVWDTAMAGQAVTLIGIESHPRPSSSGHGPAGDATVWAGGTLYPSASKKVARAITHASGRRPVVVLANLAGFDGSTWSLRNEQLEWGAEIARSVVNFRGTIVVASIGRFHGGAYVVFNKTLNPGLRMIALTGTKVSVIGGSAAAEVVLNRQVQALLQDPEFDPPGDDDSRRQAARAEVARRFDEVHSVNRALQTGSVDEIIDARTLRPAIAARIRTGSIDLRSPARQPAGTPAASV